MDENGQGRGWYLVRIPIEDFTRTIGNIAIENVSIVDESIRLWTTGHEAPVTLRFASWPRAIGSDGTDN